MYAERLILETDVAGKLKQIPLLPANKQLEAIFLVIADSEQTVSAPSTPVYSARCDADRREES